MPPAPDLSDCAREPIHIPEAIQPHGVLLAIDPASRRVQRAAGACAALLGRPAESCPGADARAVLGDGAAALLDAFWQDPMPEPAYLGSLRGGGAAAPALDITAHLVQGMAILELEPAAAAPRSAVAILAEIRAAGNRLLAAPTLPALLRAAARQVRGITGYDRVMVYRFLPDGTGVVAAEERDDRLPPLLNHRYPASDIPPQARALYLRNPIRVIPDAGYVPAPLHGPAEGEAPPLDMSDCGLRSVSPVHLQYLRNMGVAASASISIVVQDRLWGLIACHHGAPRHLSYDQRELAKHVGQTLGLQLQAREEAELRRQAARLAENRDRALRRLRGAASLERHAASSPEDLLRALPADGFALRLGSTLACCGETPDEAQLGRLVDWLLREGGPDSFATDSLVADFPEAGAYAPRASGLAAAVVARDEPAVLMWFRAEQVETVNWAGNPHKAVQWDAAGAGTGRPRRLTPRASFQVWKETVRGRARPWSPADLDAAQRLAIALFDLRQQETVRELNRHLRRALGEQDLLLQQKDLLLQEVNHRVQNSLQLVNSMLYLQSRQTADRGVKALFEDASRRILAVAKIHERLWRSDQIQSVELGAYLEELRDGLIESWGPAWLDRIAVQAAPVTVPTQMAVILALVVTELLTNAVKYAYRGEVGPVSVALSAEDGSLRLAVGDEGVGIPEDAPVDGLGSRLTRTLVAQLGGSLQILDRPTGTEVVVAVPLDMEAAAAVPAAPAASPASAAP